MKRTIMLFGIAIALVSSCKEKAENKTEQAANEEVVEVANEMSAQQGEWEVLFDGSSFDGWKGYGTDKVADVWKLEDGAMVFYPPKDRPKGTIYDINTVGAYTDFVLSLEWRISEGGNSGIFWGISEDSQFKKPYHTGPEIQVLDNEKHPDAKNGTTHQAGALYDMVAPAKDATKAVGEWNLVEITIDHKNNKGKVVLNGEEVVTFPVVGDGWDAMVADSKFKGWKGFGKYTTGKIGLQDHGDIVAYRNIKIKKL